ncbi:ankyrin repeat domain-containing protein [Legionella pneumophila]|uniref:ankyrin repeat domain-containing protein n=1 Tax=Legionella pneumophila TaxID=446 RepID=UPI001F501590|nr:ankyrin repeat domain-containing protein [Legionella pneumophila]
MDNDQLPVIHYLWVGLPTKMNPSASIAGHDVAGPIKMAKALQSQAQGKPINPIKFWCLEQHQDFYKKLFHDAGVTIEVCGIEELIRQESQGELHEQALFVQKFLNDKLPSGKNSDINQRVMFKDVFSLFLLVCQPGYFFDTNVFPATDREMSLSCRDTVATAKSGFQKSNDFYLMYSPQRNDSQMLEIFDRWVNNPSFGNLSCFRGSDVPYIEIEDLGVQKISYKSYWGGKLPGLFFWLERNNRPLFEENLPYGDINQQLACSFSRKSLAPCSVCFTEEADPEKLLAMPFTTNEAYIAIKANQIFYVNKTTKECVCVYDQFSSLFDYLPDRFDKEKIRVASESEINQLIRFLDNFSHPSYLVNIADGTLLHHAVLSNNIEQVRMLLELEAKFDLKASYQIKPEGTVLKFTPLELANYLKHEEIATLLQSYRISSTHVLSEISSEPQIMPEATIHTSDEVMQSSSKDEQGFTPQQLTIIIEAMQKALTSMGTSRFVSDRDDKEKMLVQFKSAFENATNEQERYEALRNFITTASTPRQGLLNFFPAAYGKTCSATAFYEHIKNQDTSLVEALKTMGEEKGLKVEPQSNSSVETVATMTADQARGTMQHFKRAIQAERSSELKTDNHSVDSQNLCDTGLKI